MDKKMIESLAYKLVKGIVFRFADNNDPDSIVARIEKNAKSGHKEQYLVIREEETLLTIRQPKPNPEDIVLHVLCQDDKAFIKVQRS